MTTRQNETKGALPSARRRSAKIIPLRREALLYVDGAPCQVGDLVRVDPIVKQIAREEDHPELAPFAWQKGVVVRLTYSEDDIAVGAHYPEDPMIWVRFLDGVVQNFWKDELCDPSVSTRRRG